MFDELKNITVEKPYKGIQNNGVLREQTTLDKLYKDGWWVTEIFGSQVVLVKRTTAGYTKDQPPHFIVVYKSINRNNLTKKALSKINKVQKDKWKIYQEYMLWGTWDKFKD